MVPVILARIFPQSNHQGTKTQEKPRHEPQSCATFPAILGVFVVNRSPGQGCRQKRRAPQRPSSRLREGGIYTWYAASPWYVVSRPSRSSSSLTRRPTTRSAILKE